MTEKLFTGTLNKNQNKIKKTFTRACYYGVSSLSINPSSSLHIPLGLKCFFLFLELEFEIGQCYSIRHSDTHFTLGGAVA